MTIAQIDAFLAEVFPQIDDQFKTLELTEHGARVKLLTADQHLRPGGTISGPAMFALADCAFYIAILSKLGPKAMAVTTNCSIDFMRKPAQSDLIAEVRILKMGKSLVVGDVVMISQGENQPVARASMTYSIPK